MSFSRTGPLTLRMMDCSRYRQSAVFVVSRLGIGWRGAHAGCVVHELDAHLRDAAAGPGAAEDACLGG